MSLRRTLELKATPVPFLNSLMNKLQALVNKNKQLHAEIEVLRTQLMQNTLSVIEIVKAVKINTVIPVEHFLAPHLITELHNQKKNQ